MLFSSPTFFVFFALYFVLHLLVPRGYRNYLIIAGSTIFYAWWKVEYVWVPYLLMAIAYFGVQWIAGAREHTARKGRMLITVILLFLPLLFFKYTNFLYRDIVGLAIDVRDELLELPLPLGISFITFTLTALVVDTFSSKFPPTSSPRTVLAYVLFFPHLIAGPILRPIELIPQLEHPRGAFAFRTIPAVAIFTLGLVKKLVFADQVAEVVDGIYAKTALPSGTEALFAVYGFAVQIYCDFSGYTDMAIGLALLLGARLPNNFARPYCSTTIIEFWRRWHITLSFWLRDYLYIPLGGSRGSRPELCDLGHMPRNGGFLRACFPPFVASGSKTSSVMAGNTLHIPFRHARVDPLPRPIAQRGQKRRQRTYSRRLWRRAHIPFEEHLCRCAHCALHLAPPV
jgi:D-alanyl-lipoteichoic acid acyltransferase DltB (MBOAT superfamily)